MTSLRELVKRLYDLDAERELLENASQMSQMTNVEDLQDAQRLEAIKESMNQYTADISRYIGHDMQQRRPDEGINKQISDPTKTLNSNMVAATKNSQWGRRPFGQCANNPYCLSFD